MGPLHLSDVAHLLRDFSDVFVPQLNPEHVLLVQLGLLLRAIFSLVPDRKNNHINGFHLEMYYKNSRPGI